MVGELLVGELLVGELVVEELVVGAGAGAGGRVRPAF